VFGIGLGEIIVLMLVALVIFGPERLPGVITDAARMLRQLRTLANDAKAELTSELGPELGDLDLDSLNPKTFVRKNLFGDGSFFDDDEPVRSRSAAKPYQRPAEAPALPAGEPAPYDNDAT